MVRPGMLMLLLGCVAAAPAPDGPVASLPPEVAPVVVDPPEATVDPAAGLSLSGADAAGREAAMAEAVRATKTLLGGELSKFTVVPADPWLVDGDGDPDEVRRRATDTVAWASRQLRRDFFARDLDQIWTIWLFDGADSYEGHALRLFGDRPTTPYGYADGEEHALIMDISTGGGTLVHEMVHPYVAANLPGCPPWINEGLASLYEHVGEEDGHIHGYTNWRLPGLQRAIREGERPKLQWLAESDATRFYDDDRGVHYATARYLMQWLQERGRLRPFFAAWATRRAEDPSGWQTLLDTLGEADADALSAAFDAWVLGLRRS